MFYILEQISINRIMYLKAQFSNFESEDINRPKLEVYVNVKSCNLDKCLSSVLA